MKIKIKHLTGSKSGQVEEFPASSGVLKLGRSSSCQVAYDPDLDDVVSREHASITVDEKENETFWIEDHHSSNGLFLNGRHVKEKAKIFAGDTVQLGKEGPKFTFELDPRPESHLKKTQVIDLNPLKATTLSSVPGQTPAPQKQGVGKETVQRMVAQEQKKSRTNIYLIAAGIAILVAVAGVTLWKKTERDKSGIEGVVANRLDRMNSERPLTPTEIARLNSKKVVYIEFAWKLIFTPSGEDLVHRYTTFQTQNGTGRAGLFIETSQGIEPMLITRSGNPNADFEPIRGAGSGTGFVVSQDGFIMTNRHVATAWLSSYDFPDHAFPGLLVRDGKIVENTLITKDMVKNWVPGEAMNINNESTSKAIHGSGLYLDVTFANNDLRVPASVVRISNKHDVAMIKIDLPQSLPKVDLYDNYNQITTGDAVTVLGYPGASPTQIGASRSYDPFNRNPKVVTIPVPTLSQGNIGRLIKGDNSAVSTDSYFSTFGDTYQLTINSTGPGNSGGPLFDDRGRVIGIFSAGSSMMTFAVPIKYGIELMGIQSVIDSN